MRGLSEISSLTGPLAWVSSSGGVVEGPEGGDGWDIEFWPVMTVPFSRPAEMWWEKFELMAGITLTFGGMWVMDPSR